MHYSSITFNCLAYSSSGTFSLLAIATCDDVSFTVLRPVPQLTFRVADATVCVGLVVCSVTLPNLWWNSSFILLSNSP